MVWLDPVPPFVSRDYENLKSADEYGLNLSKAAQDAPSSPTALARWSRSCGQLLSSVTVRAIRAAYA